MAPFLASALDQVSGQRHVTGALTSGIEPPIPIE